MSDTPTSPRSAGPQTKIVEEGGLHKFRTEIPNTVVRGLKSQRLSIYAKWLYVYFRSVAGEHDVCWRSTTTIASESGMSRGQVSEAKKELMTHGLITIKKGKNPKRDADHIRIKDIWLANMQEFSVRNTNTNENDEEQVAQEHHIPGVHHVNTDNSQSSQCEHQSSPYELGVHMVNQRRSQEELGLKKENSLTTFESLGGRETAHGFTPTPPSDPQEDAIPENSIKTSKRPPKKRPLAPDDWLALWLQQQTLIDIPFSFLNDDKWWDASSILVTDGFSERWLEREFAKMVLHFQKPGERAPTTEAGWKRFLTHWWQTAEKIEQREKRQEKLYGQAR